MARHRFKDKCDICGKWSHEYQSYKQKMVVCDECMKKYEGRFELDEPQQLDIYEMEELKDEA